MDRPIRIVNGTVVDATNECAITLLSKGYELSLTFVRCIDGTLKSEYTAEKDGIRVTAENEVELLGLVAMFEARGNDWGTRVGEPFIYEILYSESFIRELDGSVIENPMRWM